jgi:hypothetical protein
MISQEFDQESKQNKTDGGTVYKYMLRVGKLKTEKRGKKSELTGRSPLRR